LPADFQQACPSATGLEAGSVTLLVADWAQYCVGGGYQIRRWIAPGGRLWIEGLLLQVDPK